MSTPNQSQTAEPGVVLGTLALRTLSGDIRDRMEKLARSWTKPFDDLSHDEQEAVIETLTAVGENTARDSLTIVHGRALPTLGMKVVSAQRKGKTMRVTLEAPFTKVGWAGFGDCEEIVAVQAEPDTYFGERRPLRARPDQHDLELDDDENHDEAFEAGDREQADDSAAQLQNEALANDEATSEREGATETEAIGGDETLQEATDSEVSAGGDAAPGEEVIEAGAPTKRGRRTIKERTAANAAAAAEEPPSKRTRARNAEATA